MAKVGKSRDVQRELARIAEIMRGRIPPPSRIVCVTARTLHGRIETSQVRITVSGDDLDEVIADALRGVQGDAVDWGD